MHTIRKFMEDGTVSYRVGYYDHAATRDRWVWLGSFTELDEALAWVSYLNGGSKPPGPMPQG